MGVSIFFTVRTGGHKMHKLGQNGDPTQMIDSPIDK